MRHEPATDPDFDQFFRQEVTRALFARAVEDVRAESAARRAADVQFALFERYDLAGGGGSHLRGAGGRVRPAGHTGDQSSGRRSAALPRRRARGAARDLAGSDAEYREEAKEILGIEAGDV